MARHIKTESLEAVINVRVTPEEKASIKEQAGFAAMTVSEFGRRRFLGRPVIASVDAIMVRELRRIGGLLKHIHNESGGTYREETWAALEELRALIGRLSYDR